MLAMNSYGSRRYRMPSTTMTLTSTGPGNLLSRPRLPLRSYTKPKSSCNLASLDSTPFCRAKRLKSRKITGCPKIDAIKKKTPDYTETAYRDAVSKLKYLLVESYNSSRLTGKIPRDRGIYRRGYPRITETPEDSDDRSVSDCSRTKVYAGNQFDDLTVADNSDKNRRLITTSQNSIFPSRQQQSSPSELTSFIARQEEYIEQLEQESRYCKDELKNLLEKIREVVAENEALHDKNKAGLLKSFLREYDSCDDKEKVDKPNNSGTDASTGSGKKVKIHQILEGPNIVFESRISELEAQLTQARIELKKAREDNEASAKRLSDNCGIQARPELTVELDQALRDKRELSDKLEEALKNLQAARDRENEVNQKAKRTAELAQQADYDKYQADSEIRRLNDELDRQREKLREMSQETSRRVAEERHQVERRYSQQVEQLSADVASHWDAASKSQMESEKQRRELADLKRDLVQKQSMIDDLKKDLQNKISNLQSDLNQALAEKDAAEQEIAAMKLTAERNERHARQEQSRWQAEINSYKQRLERADADILHCRRENLRLSEQIASLEKELNMSKLIKAPETQTSVMTPRPEGEKDLTTMIMDMETKHEEPVERDDGGAINLTTESSKKKRTVKVDLKVKVTPKKKSSHSKIVTMPLSAQEEMASLQSNLEYLSSKINDTLQNKKVEQEALTSDRQNAQHDEESTESKQRIATRNNYPNSSDVEGAPYTSDYNVDPSNRFDDRNAEYIGQQEGAPPADAQTERVDNQQGEYAVPNSEKYDGQDYQNDNQNYPADYTNQDYAQYDQYDPSMYEQNPGGEIDHGAAPENVAYQQEQQQYDDYPAQNYQDNVNQSIPVDEQQYTKPDMALDTNNTTET